MGPASLQSAVTKTMGKQRSKDISPRTRALGLRLHAGTGDLGFTYGVQYGDGALCRRGGVCVETSLSRQGVCR